MRRQSARKGDLILDFIDLLESKGVIFPRDQISDFSAAVKNDDDIEKAAITLRRHWNLGLGPIPNLVKLVESKGIMVLPIHNSCQKVDAYSTWRGQRPCILVSYSKTASRIRFDVSHELGHLTMHEDAATGEAGAERQADKFAGAFLVPRESFLEECPRGWSFEAFRRLKARWKMSIQALLYRAKDFGCISVSTHRRAMIQITMEGKRKNEGDEWPKEKPVLITQALDLLHDQVTLDGLADEMSVYPGELKDMLNQCVPVEMLNKINRKKDTESATIVKLRK
jgi:Zn-dependent peptidase ImmA (M78 family)